MMKKLLLILIALPMIGFGQNWERYYADGMDSTTIGYMHNNSSVQQTTDGGYIACGAILVLPGTNWTSDVLLIKTTPQGDTIWQKKFNNYLDSRDNAYDVKQTSDGGYIICGSTRIDTASFPREDIYLIKTDANGDLLWSRTIADTLNSSEIGYSIEQTTDGGYIIGGVILPSHLNYCNTYLVKTNSLGIVQWNQTFQKCYSWFSLVSVQQTTDGGYLIGSQQQDDSTNNFHSNLIKTDALGNQQWNKVGPKLSWNNNTVYAEQTSDGGYILSCTVTDTLSFHNNSNIHLIKSDAFGNQQWSQTSTDTLEKDVNAIHQTSDGGYIICGSKKVGWGTWDITRQLYIAKTDALGNNQWEREFGDIALADWGYSVQQTSDGGYIISGITEIIHEAVYAIYLIKTDNNGNVTSTFNIPTPNANRKLEKVVDILGKQTKTKTNVPLFYIYDDGTVEKRIVIE